MTEAFVPKTIAVFREGYDLHRLKADALAGLTVAIVALPLSMAIAIASGVTPDRGLYTAIVGGFLVSLLGGSRHQIGGPAGAFIVLVASTVATHGVEGLILATMISGLFLMLAGLLRLGDYVKFIPYPVTVGFTAGIAVIIFASQISELLGLTLVGKEPGPLVEKLPALFKALPTVNPAAAGIAALTVATILLLRRLRPTWPGMLIAVALASLATAFLALDVGTIGTRFGGIPRSLPLPRMPDFSLQLFQAVLPNAMAFALLGAIESLLSAVVADGMTGRRHRSNVELIGQGIANIGSGLFGGFCVTGTIARTATNVRAGGTSPVAGMLHALFLLLFMAAAAPLASYIPLASLAGVLSIVSWNMIERPAFAALIRTSRGDAVVLLVTLLLVVFRDLTEGIIVGFALGAMLFIGRMSKSVTVAPQTEDKERPLDNSDSNTVVYRLGGAFFFGAAATVGSVLDRIADQYHHFVLDCSGLHFIDSTGANVIAGTLRKARRAGVTVYITGAEPDVRRTLETHEVHGPNVVYLRSVTEARAMIAGKSTPP
ncbi:MULTISPECIES: SulP family inorganic anion transporter [Alphaproteobacteria]|uniref:Sulfate transporter family protein n=2 Tax=Alphaproteobacteria TaxID=28211 RepID=A0A512HCJ2_9HYPH|nr:MULTISPECIES: SulP family inorganic anion transporter [Alphaproteobacteria]GEO83167.1 sulfate transporter family protein [Ciceribacter naphthalenivorans]GLR20438.1 sulfate transporter family protein [Ciceribacter naphthalenivorans]GLT03294.1 sulfate transporter family protein [Sphingomonas psychrolutea]